MSFVLYWLSDFKRADSISLRCQALGDYLGRDVFSDEFIAQKHGKPVLKSGECSFNACHSAGYYFLIAHSHADVGIDYEKPTKKRNISRLVQRVLSETEQKVYFDLNDTLQDHYFFDIWQQKEALGKAKGLGVQLGFGAINIVDYKYPNNVDGWSVAACTVTPEVSVYIAAKRKYISEEIEFRRLTNL